MLVPVELVFQISYEVFRGGAAGTSSSSDDAFEIVINISDVIDSFDSVGLVRRLPDVVVDSIYFDDVIQHFHSIPRVIDVSCPAVEGDVAVWADLRRPRIVAEVQRPAGSLLVRDFEVRVRLPAEALRISLLPWKFSVAVSEWPVGAIYVVLEVLVPVFVALESGPFLFGF